ncbi:hypothetical protein L7F22_010759 [Adiantum nelumboides]|nr:hypothetical protein [Adiantum nelumboides]
MDTGYVGSDPAIFKASFIPALSNSPVPYPDSIVSLVRQPLPLMAGSNLPHPARFEASSRMKGEDMSGIFARAMTHLYMQQTQQAKQYAEMSQSSPPSTCDLRATLQQIVSTPFCTTPFLSRCDQTMDNMMTPTNNLNMYHKSPSSYMVMTSKLHPQPVLREQDTLQLPESENEIYSLVPSTSFSEMLHAIEISETSSLPLKTSLTDPNQSFTKAVPPSNIRNQNFRAATIHSDASQCPNSPSKQDSSVMSAEDSDGDQKLSSNNSTKKRNCGHRKSQQKRVVHVPFCENKQRGEAPLSDTWAWRKYGQKPIKGSPFPRGYYRCSSSKGCPARKQVERSRNDPSTVMVTYTAEHNHPWPVNKQSSSSKEGNQDKSQAMEDANNQHHNAENLFSSIINSPNRVDQDQVVSSMDPLEDGESFLLQRDVDLCLSRTSTEGDDVFDNLGELPELSAIFSKGFVDEYFDEEKFEQSELL